MSRVTLVWVSKRASSCRTFSLPKPLVYVTVVGLFVFWCTAVTILWWTQGLYGQSVDQQEQNRLLHHRLAALRQQSKDQREQNRLLQHRLTEAKLRLENQGHEVEDLRQEKQQMLDELRQIQTTENKIRRFLGLNERLHNSERSHQGGMGSEVDVSPLEPDVSPMGRHPTAAKEAFSEFSQSLHSGLQETLAHLEEKRLESRRLPTLLPAASDKVWLAGTFGTRTDPISGTRQEFHNGIDVAGPWKSPIIAPADGTVLKVGKDRRLGIYVKLRHTKKIKTLYGHLASASVKKGAKVKRGDVIGYMGNTGRSTGTHLHYSVAVNGKYVDPLDFVWDRPFRSLKL